MRHYHNQSETLIMDKHKLAHIAHLFNLILKRPEGRNLTVTAHIS
jgi:hypothetical protein